MFSFAALRSIEIALLMTELTNVCTPDVSNTQTADLESVDLESEDLESADADLENVVLERSVFDILKRTVVVKQFFGEGDLISNKHFARPQVGKDQFAN